jgi:hypothetical protein
MTAVQPRTPQPRTGPPGTPQPGTPLPGTLPPGTLPPGTLPPTAIMSGRYQRAFTVAVVVLVAGWHLAGAGGQLLHGRPA